MHRLLIADADTDTRALYHEAFRVGWDCVEASDGRDALAKALTRTPTLVITELYLPELDGFALCEILRRNSGSAWRDSW
jgi:DNA-binding response OmpR family regulator